MASWVARLMGAQKVGMDAVLNIRIFGSGEELDITLTYSMTDPNVNIDRVKSDIEHYAKALGRWPQIQSKIGNIIHSGQ